MEQKEFEPSSGRDFEGFSHFFLFSSAYVEPEFEPRGSDSSDTLKQRAQKPSRDRGQRGREATASRPRT